MRAIGCFLHKLAALMALIFPTIFFCADKRFWCCTKLCASAFARNSVKNVMSEVFYAGFNEEVNTF